MYREEQYIDLWDSLLAFQDVQCIRHLRGPMLVLGSCMRLEL